MGNFVQRLLLVFLSLSTLAFLIALLKVRQPADKDRRRVGQRPALIVDVSPLKREIRIVQEALDKERDQLETLDRQLDRLITQDKHIFRKRSENSELTQSAGQSTWESTIPVLVFVCSRAEALTQHVNKLISYRPSPVAFPIVVSQDCDNKETKEAALKFQEQILYVKHLSAETARVKVPSAHRQYALYYKISRHYSLGLRHVFDKLNYSSVIITEDDLDIAPDFFHYFAATRNLLARDGTLYCVSAWNDNGRRDLIDTGAAEQLYRSDFFPGLGWMMTKDLWLELREGWPAGFWDDWIREPEQRKGRQCIRPEISRTGMTDYGRAGASRGLFFNKYLRAVLLSERKVDFTRLQLDYLLSDQYAVEFTRKVYSSPLINIDELLTKAFLTNGTQQLVAPNNAAYRVEYHSMNEYAAHARRLNIMADSKAGVPRTAYRGIVTCFINGIRIYLTMPEGQWNSYDRQWEAPADALIGE